MITGKVVYDVLAAIVPLYVPMILAYGTVRWWKIFTPDQCSGINHFVALFAVPFLSFYFISSNDPYAMNFRFIAADNLQKVVILAALFLWQALTKRGNLEWMITLFSLSTLPSILVMGIPLLTAMYGDFSQSLMVQMVVLQSLIWYTLLLFFYEYRGAKLLILEQFPQTASSINSFRVDSDVVSLNEHEPLQADAEIGDDGKLHVVFRRSGSSSMNSSFNMSHRLAPRASNLTGVEIYSVQSSFREPTPRASSFNGEMFKIGKQRGGRSMSTGELFNGGVVSSYPPPNPMFSGGTSKKNESGDGGAMPNKDLHMFERSSSASPVSEAMDSSNKAAPQNESAATEANEESRDIEIEDEREGEKKQQMPAASVMTRLILVMVWRKLIRNPNTYASLLGLIWSLISFRWHIQMPTIVSRSIWILSNTGLGLAMFSLGLFMALQPKIIACGKSVATFAMAVRFLIGPAVMAASSVAVGCRGVLLHVAIVQAALPQGIVAFVFAKEYNVHADILSTAVIFGTLIALPITIIYYVLLGV